MIYHKTLVINNSAVAMTTIGRLRPSLFRCLSFLSAALLCLRRICVFFFFSLCLLTHRRRRTRDPLLSCFAMYIAVRARARVCTYACLCAYFLPPYGVPSPPGAGCFTGTIWQEQSRPGDSARVTASPRSTFSSEGCASPPTRGLQQRK